MVVGDLTVSDTTRTNFVQRAADEMDQALGTVYIIALTPIPPAGTLPASALLALKRCNYLIASGRLLLDRAAVSEDVQLHAYGESLLQEGQMLLYSIMSGSIFLGATKINTADAALNTGPQIFEGDATSGVDAYYEWGRTDPWPSSVAGRVSGWRPGK